MDWGTIRVDERYRKLEWNKLDKERLWKEWWKYWKWYWFKSKGVRNQESLVKNNIGGKISNKKEKGISTLGLGYLDIGSSCIICINDFFMYEFLYGLWF